MAKPIPKTSADPASTPFARRESLGYLVNRLARLFARALERRLKRHRVPLGQFPVLLALWEEERLTQSEIARRLDIEQPTVANTLRRMERDGLVETAHDPTNGRRILISLTARGRALRGPLTREASAVNAAATSGASEKDIAGFRAAMAWLESGLRKEIED